MLQLGMLLKFLLLSSQVLFVLEIIIYEILPLVELNILKYIELCIVTHFKQDIKMAALFRNTGTNQLLLSFIQPHKPISTVTLSRWF